MLPEIGSRLLYPCRPFDSQSLLFLPWVLFFVESPERASDSLSLYRIFMFPFFCVVTVIVFQSFSMIRFPPTSIALSESDIEFHLREIQIKQQLYAQGFTQKEVQRYYNERHGHVNGCDVEDDVLLTLTQSSTCSKAKTKPSQGVEPDALKEDRRRPSGWSGSSLTPALRLTIFSR